MEKFLSLIPFLLVTKHDTGNIGSPSDCISHPSNGKSSVKLNTSRMIEGVIIAAIAGLLSSYITTAKLEVKVDNLANEIKAVETRIYNENSRQEKRIDDNLSRIERMTDILTKLRIK